MPSEYYEQRLNSLGITEEMNVVKLWKYDAQLKEDTFEETPIFRDKEEGIAILVYSIDRLKINYAKEGSRYKINEYCIIRLKEPVTKKDGSTQKYRLPRGQGTHPFFHPWLLELYDQKKPIDTLYLTEGYFKAFKGCMHGIPVVGLTSITHIKDKEKGTLHPDILGLIQACKVKTVVWLTDGDCLNITTKELTEQVDLYRRPHGFFNSVVTFRQVLADHNVDLYFMHVDSLALGRKTETGYEPGPKGLDDLLIDRLDEIPAVVEDIRSLSKPGQYFQKFNVTNNGQEQRVLRHFRLKDVNEFFSFHVEFRPDLANNDFKWNGNRYRYDPEKGTCKLLIPSDAALYFRVGNDYYKFIHVPDKYGQLARQFKGRMKGTIVDDHGKEFTKHIPKYEAFCNVPDHTNFQQVMHSCFNIYSPFEWEPDSEPCDEEDCPTIISFIQHIFGSADMTYTNPRTKDILHFKQYQLGLDYMQLLYTHPTQVLPILCLVSKENETGKSTYANLLKMIFTSNVAIVGNADLANDFNSAWASKLLVICDEAKIDKSVVVERIKSLSTASKIMMNAKGKDHVELDFFGKFLLLTNNEDNFIYASEEDLRYWVVKVPRITSKNPDLIQKMQDEIPAFLSYLSRRKMATERLTRMWFDPVLLKTDALKKVIAHSMPTIEKELRNYFRDAFLDFGVDQIMMTRKTIHKEVLNNRFEASYLESVLKERLQVDLYHEFEFDGQMFPTLEAAEGYAGMMFPDEPQLTLFAKIERVYKIKRHAYPRWERRVENQVESTIRVEVKDNGRPYVFHRKDFVTEDDERRIKYDPETKYTNDITSDTPFPNQDQASQANLL